MEAIVIIEGLVILLLLLLVAGLLKSHAEILRQLHSLGSRDTSPPSGGRLRTTGFEEAPMTTIQGVGPDGSAVTVSVDNDRNESLLAFLSSGCASCREFWSSLNGSVEMPTPTTRPIIVTKGPSAESPGKIADLAPKDVTVVMSDQAWDTFKVPITPYFMLIDRRGRVVGEGSASNWPHLLSLLSQSIGDDPRGMTTSERESFTDSQLRSSGVSPGDPSLYEDPLG